MEHCVLLAGECAKVSYDERDLFLGRRAKNSSL